MDKITKDNLKSFTSAEELEPNKAYLFYGLTDKGAKFYSTGFTKEKNDGYLDDPKSKKEKVKNKLRVYLDQDYYNDTMKITHYIECSYVTE